MKKLILICVVIIFSVNFTLIANADDGMGGAEFGSKKENQDIIEIWNYDNSKRYELVITKLCGMQEDPKTVLFLRTFVLSGEDFNDAKTRLINEGLISSKNIKEENQWWFDADNNSVSRIITFF